MVILIASLFWALWDEDFGQRPWKSYQHQFKERYRAFLNTTRTKSDASEKEIQNSSDYKALKDSLNQISQQTSPRMKELQKQIADLNSKILAVQAVFTDRRAYVNAL